MSVITKEFKLNLHKYYYATIDNKNTLTLSICVYKLEELFNIYKNDKLLETLIIRATDIKIPEALELRYSTELGDLVARVNKSENESDYILLSTSTKVDSFIEKHFGVDKPFYVTIDGCEKLV